MVEEVEEVVTGTKEEERKDRTYTKDNTTTPMETVNTTVQDMRLLD